jgi:hypothetical protein
MPDPSPKPRTGIPQNAGRFDGFTAPFGDWRLRSATLLHAFYLVILPTMAALSIVLASSLMLSVQFCGRQSGDPDPLEALVGQRRPELGFLPAAQAVSQSYPRAVRTNRNQSYIISLAHRKYSTSIDRRQLSPTMNDTVRVELRCRLHGRTPRNPSIPSFGSHM